MEKQNVNDVVIKALKDGFYNNVRDKKISSSIKFNINDVELDQEGFYIDKYIFNEKNTKKFFIYIRT